MVMEDYENPPLSMTLSSYPSLLSRYTRPRADTKKPFGEGI